MTDNRDAVINMYDLLRQKYSEDQERDDHGRFGGGGGDSGSSGGGGGGGGDSDRLGTLALDVAAVGSSFDDTAGAIRDVATQLESDGEMTLAESAREVSSTVEAAGRGISNAAVASSRQEASNALEDANVVLEDVHQLAADIEDSAGGDTSYATMADQIEGRAQDLEQAMNELGL